MPVMGRGLGVCADRTSPSQLRLTDPLTMISQSPLPVYSVEKLAVANGMVVRFGLIRRISR